MALPALAPEQEKMTAAEFEAYAALPENADRILQFIAGEVVEVPSNPFASSISVKITSRMSTHVEANDLGTVTGEAGGYRVAGERYAPDVAFLAKGKPLAHQGYNTVAPDLAVEVVYPADAAALREFSLKIGNYLAAGTVLWGFFPEDKEVQVYIPGQPVKVLGIDDVLDGGDVLPGFTLPIRSIFGQAVP
jgi:Uma2 family endonuclease